MTAIRVHDFAEPETPVASAPPSHRDALLGTYKRAPMQFVRGAGVEMFDADGRAYLDFASGIAVNALGYGDPGVEQAIRDAMSTGLIHVSNLYHTAPGAALAERLCDLSGFASHAFFCNSGAEANEGAFKFVRRWARESGHPERVEILGLRGGFHGRLFASLAATDRPGYRAPFRPLAGGVSVAERDIAELRAALVSGTVGAVIVEPVQGEGGVRVLEPEFLRDLRALTREHGVMLIVDEIQTGLGRTGHVFAYQASGIEPDLVTLAKPLAAGLPMGAILVTDEIARTIQSGDHGTTFGGGPLVASVALHVVGRLSDPVMLKHVRQNGEWLGDALRQIGERCDRVRAVRGAGYMWGIDVHEKAAAVVLRALASGLMILTAGEHTLRLLPPLVMTQADLARGVASLEDALGCRAV